MDVMITANEEFMEQVDSYCREHKYHRSEFFREAARDKMFKNEKRAESKVLNDKINKAEKEVAKITEKAKQLSTKSPLKLGGRSKFDICPKHNSMFDTCGCGYR